MEAMTFDQAKALIDYALKKVNGMIWTNILVFIVCLIGIAMSQKRRKE